jgi:hypothetical protein
MGTIDEERTGVLVLRAWVEAGEEANLRVRIIWLVQGDAAEPVSTAAATIDGVCMTVRSWLEDLLYGWKRRHRGLSGEAGSSGANLTEPY